MHERHDLPAGETAPDAIRGRLATYLLHATAGALRASAVLLRAAEHRPDLADQLCAHALLYALVGVRRYSAAKELTRS